MRLGVTHLLLLLVVVVMTTHWTHSHYVAMVPNVIRPQFTYRVPIRVSGAGGSSVNVEGKILDSKNVEVETASVVINDGDADMLNFNMNALPSDQLRLTLTGTGGLSFTNETNLKTESVACITLIQTDRGTYMPGDVVHFRVLAIDEELQPRRNSRTIRVKNPGGSIMQKYVDDGSVAVYEDIFEVFEDPTLGDWKVEVEYEDDFCSKEERIFKVDEFVPPKFEVRAVLNSAFLVVGKSGNVDMTVSAVYTYGKGVKGRMNVKIGERKDDDDINIEFDKTAVVSINLGKEIESMQEWEQEREVRFVVNVTDVSKHNAITTVSVKLSKNPAKVKFVPELSDSVYRVGTRTKLVWKVTDPVGGELSDNYSGSLKITLTYWTDEQNKMDTTFTLNDGNNGYYTWVLDDTSAFPGSVDLRADLNIDDYDTVTDSYNLQKYQTVGTASLNARWISMPENVGDEAEFRVEVNPPGGMDLSSIWYMVASRGQIVKRAKVTDLDQSVTVTITHYMCPKVDILVFGSTSATPTPEIIADHLKAEVKGCNSKEVSTSSTEGGVKTGEVAPINVQVSWTDPDESDPIGQHKVYLLAVDKSMVLLQNSLNQNNDITMDRVEEGLKELTLGSTEQDDNPQPVWRRRKRSIMPFPYPTSPPTSTGELLKNLGLTVLGDVDLKDVAQYGGGGGPIMLFGAEMAEADDGDVMKESAADVDDNTGAPDDDEDTTVVRTHFPDTWIWETWETDANGYVSRDINTPDSITSWVVSAFAVRDQQEIATAKVPNFELAVYNPFFVSMTLPYSIRRTEVFVLRCTVFSYEEFDRNTDVTLSRSEDFEADGGYTKNVMVQSNGAVSVEFTIKATTVKTISLTVTAKGTRTGDRAGSVYTDVLTKDLIVKPEGEKHTMVMTLPMIMKPEDTSMEKTLMIKFPEDTVPQSKSCLAFVTGDLMGNSLSNIEDLIKQPYGCGEQNMISVMPNVVAQKYLTTTGQGSVEDTEKAIKFMKQGYAREQNYRWRVEYPGLYSAFGESDPAPSTWLSAFVLRVFSMAKEYIPNTVDIADMSQTAQTLWDLEFQAGKFEKKGMIHHDDMTGGTGSGDAFHNYIVMCLKLADLKGISAEGSSSRLNAAFDKVRERAEDLLADEGGPVKKKRFDAAIMAYTLTLDQSVDVSRVQGLIDYVKAAGAPWLETDEDDDSEGREPVPYWHRPVGPSDVEITAYCVLALLTMNRASDAFALVTWLQEQQNERGGWSSTQDTMMALEAIAAYAATLQNSGDCDVTLADSSDDSLIIPMFSIDDTNRRVLQREELPTDINELTVTASKASGESCAAQTKIACSYYLKPGDKDTGLILTVGRRKDGDLVKYTNCLRLKGGDDDTTGMYMMSISPPSCYVLDNLIETKQMNRQAKKIEMNKATIDIYLDPPTKEQCLTLLMRKDCEVKNIQPGVVNAYSYYNMDSVFVSVDMVPLEEGDVDDPDPTDQAAPLASLNRLLLTTVLCLLTSLLLVL